MKSILSIDWLCLHCEGFFSENEIKEVESKPLTLEHQCKFDIKRLDFGTRQFKSLYEVAYRERLFATVQAEPCSAILNPRMVLIKLANYYLYRSDGLTLFDLFLRYYSLTVKGISRIDLALDFQTFNNDLKPAEFLAGYMAGKYRHVGRSRGNAFFNQAGGASIIYNGLSFGTHSSSTRVYLYNKTLELKQIKDKPYIRDKWNAAGFDANTDTWRLEVSLKADALKFKDKSTKTEQHITYAAIHNMGNVSKYYYTFAESLFSFVVWRQGITNITREPRMQLLPQADRLTRWVVREDVLPSCVADKIAIKRLWYAQNNYHIGNIIQEQDITRSLADEMAMSKDLSGWLAKAAQLWQDEMEKGKIKVITQYKSFNKMEINPISIYTYDN